MGNEPLAGREATALSVIREIKEVQGGGAGAMKWQPRPPQRFSVKPFSLEGLLNVILLILTPILIRGPNGLPGGHANLGRGLLGLE